MPTYGGGCWPGELGKLLAGVCGLAMIEFNQVRFEYPGSTFVLQIDDLQIGPRERVAVIGPSGSGKTTLLNLIAGIAVPQAGRVRVHQRELAQCSDTARRNFRIAHIGFVFQQFELVPYLRLLDNVLLPYLINPHLKLTDEVRGRAESLLQRMGLADKRRRFIHQLSQGEQQRVAVCRALIAQPPIILADEPTGNLDPANKHKVLALLFDEAARAGQTLLAVTHDTGILDGFQRTIDFASFHRQGVPR